jgi:EAL domain-containing protein (putative c-di-GMP-specific phosphodiesterase class I)
MANALAAAAIAPRIDRACRDAELQTVFQPLIDLAHDHVVAYEALTRFPGDVTWTTRDWFANANAVGLGLRLELAAVANALTHLDEIPPDTALAINVSAAVAMTDAFFELVAPVAPRLIVELTEHDPVDDYEALSDQLENLRRLGARIAVDDVGAGFSSLRHTFLLEPDIVKLDLSLTSVIASDARTRALITTLVRYAARTGASVAAEGIESEVELERVRALGIDHGQGYLLGRPGPLTVSLN